jgi:hypothetical protein
MPDREVIIKEIERLMVHFPNYHPVLEGDINVVNEFFEVFKGVSAGAFREALHDLTVEPGRKFVPSTGEIKHAINELKYKGMTPGQREDAINGLKPMSEALREVLPDYDMTDEDALQRNLKWMEKEQK